MIPSTSTEGRNAAPPACQATAGGPRWVAAALGWEGVAERGGKSRERDACSRASSAAARWRNTTRSSFPPRPALPATQSHRSHVEDTSPEEAPHLSNLNSTLASLRAPVAPTKLLRWC